MGMDVYGKAATSEEGEYFRNNVWWWRPLASYVTEVHPELAHADTVSWGTNDGEGLDAKDALALADALDEDLKTGRAAAWHDQYEASRMDAPDTTCDLCEGTGTRTDAIAVEHGWDKGPCNGCEGSGKKDNWLKSYPFSLENLAEFAKFCRHSGGFEIH